MNKENFDSKPIKSVKSVCGDSENIGRTLTMLEKALDRLLRQSYHHPNQYPPIVLEIEVVLNNLRSWYKDYMIFDCHPGFISILGLTIKNLGQIISQLIVECKDSDGKQHIKKTKNSTTKRTLSIN